LNGESEKNDALFVNLVLIFQGAAMQQMGKIINPLSGKVERNLEQARFSIDTLAMLKDKTKGNLSSDIERLLDSTLLQLRMNYVEEVAAGEGRTEETPPGEGSAQAETGEQESAGEKPEGPEPADTGSVDREDEAAREGRETKAPEVKPEAEPEAKPRPKKREKSGAAKRETQR
jgi:hypothetical protein